LGTNTLLSKRAQEGLGTKENSQPDYQTSVNLWGKRCHCLNLYRYGFHLLALEKPDSLFSGTKLKCLQQKQTKDPQYYGIQDNVLSLSKYRIE